MFAFIACLLVQFEESKDYHVGADNYLRVCYITKEARCDRELAQREEAKAALGNGTKRIPGLRSVDVKKRLASIKTDIQVLRAQRNNDALINDLPLVTSNLQVGQIGVLTSAVPVIGYDPKPAVVTVLQVLGNGVLLCQAPDPVVIRGVDTSKIVDNDTVAFSGQMVVFGKFTYTNSIGARKTVLAMEPWKNAEAFAKARRDAIDSVNKKATATTTPTKK